MSPGFMCCARRKHSATPRVLPSDKDPQASSDKDPQVPGDKDPQAPSDKDPQTSSDKDPQAPSDKDPQTSSDKDPQASPAASPQTNGNITSSQVDGNFTSSQNDRNVKPLQTDGKIVPLQTGGNITPAQTGRNVTGPQKDGNVSPAQRVWNVAALKKGRNITPVQTDRNVAALQKGRNITPVQNGRSFTRTLIDRNVTPSFQTDGNIKPTTKAAERSAQHVKDPFTCPKHPNCTLLFLCNDCKEFVCQNFCSKRHQNHSIKSVPDVLSWSQEELVVLCEQDLQTALNKVQKEKECLRNKQCTLESLIRQNSDTLVKWVQAATVKSLVMLENTSQNIFATLSVNESILTEKITALRDVKKSLTNTGKAKNQSSKGNKQQLIQLASNLPSAGDVPVLYHNDLSFELSVLVDYIGYAFPFSQSVSLIPDMSMKLVFNCCENSQVDVNALCPSEGGNVWIAYGDSCSEDGQWVALYTQEGGVKNKQRIISSLVCVTRLRDNWVIAEGDKMAKAWLMTPNQRWEWCYTGPEKFYHLYSKLTARFYLCVHRYGACDLRSVVVQDSDADVPNLAGTKICDIALSSLPLAMDVSKDGEIIAVLEESRDKVLIFKNGSKDPKPAITYSPEDAVFTPYDLCFCWLGGQERLVVADYLNDILHVLHVTGESCTLIGHLGGGYPLLTKPTAVSGDSNGGLWIGCRGGNVLLMQPPEIC